MAAAFASAAAVRRQAHATPDSCRRRRRAPPHWNPVKKWMETASAQEIVFISANEELFSMSM